MGVEYSFEAIGRPDTARQAFDMLRAGGTAVIVGVMGPAEISFPGMAFMDEKKVIGCQYGSARFREHMPKLVDLFLQGRLNMTELVIAADAARGREPGLPADARRQGGALGARDQPRLRRSDEVTSGSDVYYDPYDVQINADPYPTYARLREEAPLYRNDKHDFYALSRFEDVERGFVDRETYISGRGSVLELIKSNIKMPPGVVIFEDPPVHTVHRACCRACSRREG